MRKYELASLNMCTLYEKWQTLKRQQGKNIIHGITYGRKHVIFFGADCDTYLISGNTFECLNKFNNIRYIILPISIIDNIIVPHCVTKGIHLTITNISEK